MPEIKPNKYEPKPIEKYFPIEKINAIAEKEGVGFLKLKFRPYLYTMVWWARRLGCIFRAIILYSLFENRTKIRFKQEKLQYSRDIWSHYIEDVDFSDKIILDPFMGGGTTISEAIKFNCNVIGCDLNPVAWFMVKKQLEPVEPQVLREHYGQLKADVKEKIQRYYKTECPKCGNEANVIYFFWVKEVPCYNCSESVPLFTMYRIESNFGKNKEDIVYCPECSNIFGTPNYRTETACPNCNFNFIPKDGNATKAKHTCRNCNQTDVTVEAVRRSKKVPNHKMIAIKYSCPKCGSVDYKSISEKDKKLYQRCIKEFNAKKEELLFPKQKIPSGYNTNQTLNYQYKHFYEFFNERQLLCLSELFKRIIEFKDERIKELLLLSFLKALDSNNMFCGYDSTEGNLQNMFARHDFAPKKLPVENNVWGTKEGARTFEKNVETLIEAMEFCKNPVERYVPDGELKSVKLHNEIKADLCSSFDELSGGKKTLLLCQSSESLKSSGPSNIPDRSIDAVITDPPYYDNDQYAELADFFYVWLRIALKNKYKYFQSELTPKQTEIVKNTRRKPPITEEEYINGLTNVFSEMYRVLKDNGIMVFTFHHSNVAAWAAILKSVLDANFYITSIYPVNSEVNQSLLIREKGNIQYDVVVVCRKKKQENVEKSWESLEDQIYFKAQSEIKKLEKSGKRLSKGDIFVIAMGKCLESYSKYYPNVIKKGRKVRVKEALESIRGIVDEQIMEERFDSLVREFDTIAAVYLSFILGRGNTIAYSTLNKELQHRYINIRDLLNSGLVEQKGNYIKVLDLNERASRIRKKKEDDITTIDRAHYLIYLMKEDRLAKELRDWASEKAIKALEVLAGIQNNKEYKKLADFVKNKMGQTGLNTFR